MAFYLFNCSVDSPDTQRDHLSDPVTINDQESLLEILIEKVLEYDGAIAEYDEDDAENSSLKKIVSIDFFLLPPDAAHKYVFEGTGPALPSPPLEVLLPACRKMHAPPPEA